MFITEQVTEYSRHVPGKNSSYTGKKDSTRSDTDARRLCFVLDAISSILFLLLWMRTLFYAIPFKNVIALIDVKMRHETVKKFGRNRSFSGAFVRKYSRTNEKEEEVMTLLWGIEFERKTYSRFVFQISTRTDASLIW